MFYYCIVTTKSTYGGAVYVSSYLSDEFKTEKECVNDAIYEITEKVISSLATICSVEWYEENEEKLKTYFGDCDTMRKIDTKLKNIYKTFSMSSAYTYPPSFDIVFKC
jgi:hypothetical protein